MVDISANNLEQFERRPTRSIFYDDSPNCRNPVKGPKHDKHCERPPSPRIYCPGHPRDNTFLAHLQCKQPSSIERITGLPDYKQIISDLEGDFTSRWVGNYRLQKNFHRLTSLFVIKEAFEGEGMHFWTEDLDCEDAKWQFQGDRYLKQSLLARTVFSLRFISVGDGVPFAQTSFSQLYRGIFDKNYRQWSRTHLRYREGPRRPAVLLVARSRLQSASAIGECPVEIAACPYRRPNDLFRVYDKELWKSMSAQERIDACELVLRDNVDERVHCETRKRWLELGEIPEGLFQSLKPEEAEQVIHDAGMPRLRQAARKAFAAAVANLLNLFEMCGSVYGCVVIDCKFARMYVLSSGRIAVEFSNAGELADLSVPVQGRGGMAYAQVMEMDIHAALPTRFTGDERSPRPANTAWLDRLGDQVTDVEMPEDPTPKRKFDRYQTTADLAGIQTYVDFMAAGVVRLSAVNVDIAITERLPTPVQDAVDADILACLVHKGLPTELAIKIRAESRRLDTLAAYLDFSAEEQRNRPESKGLWRRIVQHWKDGHDPTWDYFPEDSSSDGEVSEASTGGGAGGHDSDRGPGSDTASACTDDDIGEEGGDAPAVDSTGSEADDESESDRGKDSDASSANSLSAHSPRTRQWILETGSDAGNTEAHETDWRTFDPWQDNDDVGGDDDVGYSSWSAENDWYETIQRLESDTRFVLSITERVLQELSRIVPVTKEEMDQLVQTQYELDMERYE